MQTWKALAMCLAGLVMVASGCTSPPNISPQGQRAVLAVESPLHAADAEAPKTIDWKADVGDVIGVPGVLADDVYLITAPRRDIDLSIDGMDVPTAAGIGSHFYFYRCSCGKVSVLGEFILLDFEANDVIDALRPGALISVTAVGPFAIGDKPRLLSVRFHGEGDGPSLSKRIKEAMRWTGEERGGK